MNMKEESEKAGLKLNIQNTNIMASGPITSWQIDRETVETVRVFILEGSKITADHDCSHEIKSLLHLYAEYIMQIPGWKHKLESRWLGEVSITSDMQMKPHLWQKVKSN